MQLIPLKEVDKYRESARQQIVKWVFVVYWLLILEGVLRKWIVPQFNQIIFFVRDPFVLYIYWLAWKNKVSPHKSLLLIVGISVAYLSALVMFLQIMTSGLSFTVGLYGWRNYFLYIPLAFIIGSQFCKKDLDRLIKQTLLFSIPIAFLVVLQSLAPSDAVINRGISADYAFTPLAGGVLRTQGTFTSTLGQTMFIGSIIAMLIPTLILPGKKRILTGFPLYIATFAAIVNLLVSGSRSAFVTTIILAIATILYSTFLGNLRQFRMTLIAIAFIGFFGIFATQTFFYSQFHALVNRAQGAAGDNAIGSDILQRIIDSFIGFINIALQMPFFGIGLGTAGNAGAQLGIELSIAAEDDWSRHIVELGPFLGISYILFRVALVIWLFSNAIKTATYSNNTLLPILLTTFTGIIFINGTLTGHGSVNGYGWLFLGFSIAANNLGQVREIPRKLSISSFNRSKS